MYIEIATTIGLIASAIPILEKAYSILVSLLKKNLCPLRNQHARIATMKSLRKTHYFHALSLP